MLSQQLMPNVQALSVRKVIDIVSALAKSGRPEMELFANIERDALNKSYKFQDENLVNKKRFVDFLFSQLFFWGSGK